MRKLWKKRYKKMDEQRAKTMIGFAARARQCVAGATAVESAIRGRKPSSCFWIKIVQKIPKKAIKIYADIIKYRIWR